MLKKILSTFSIVAVILIFVFSPMNVEADFGDFSGGDDYGGYDDYDYGGYDYGGGYRGGFGGAAGTEMASLVFAIIIFLVYISSIKRAGNKSGNKPVAPGATPTVGLWPMDSIKQWDPNFSEDAIKERLSNLYVQMQNCWTAKDITPLRGDFTDTQFAQYDSQLERYRREGITNMIERIAVLDVSLMGVKQDATHDILIANIYTRITTYSIKDETGEIVRGDKNKEKFMQYEWTLVRPRGAQTRTEEKVTTNVNCPNCGGVVDINKSAKCPYCGSIVSRPNYNWVISGIKGLSQRTK